MTPSQKLIFFTLFSFTFYGLYGFTYTVAKIIWGFIFWDPFPYEGYTLDEYYNRDNYPLFRSNFKYTAPWNFHKCLCDLPIPFVEPEIHKVLLIEFWMNVVYLNVDLSWIWISWKESFYIWLKQVSIYNTYFYVRYKYFSLFHFWKKFALHFYLLMFPWLCIWNLRANPYSKREWFFALTAFAFTLWSFLFMIWWIWHRDYIVAYTVDSSVYIELVKALEWYKDYYYATIFTEKIHFSEPEHWDEYVYETDHVSIIGIVVNKIYTFLFVTPITRADHNNWNEYIYHSEYESVFRNCARRAKRNFIRFWVWLSDPRVEARARQRRNYIKKYPYLTRKEALQQMQDEFDEGIIQTV